ncbi:MAG: T9SS type A sorting domain-containing protein [Bacteroidota bacterium]
MKNYFSIFFFLWIGWFGAQAQVTPVADNCGVSFDYDDAGNRIKRYYCVDRRRLQFEESTDEQANRPIDLEGTLAQSPYSVGLEAEIEKLEALLSQPSHLDLQKEEVTENQLIELTDQNFSNLSDLLVFPNPTRTSFSIQGSELHPESTLSIVSMDGRVLTQRVLGDGRDVDVSSLPEGTYLVTLIDKDQRRVCMLFKAN